MATQLKEPEPTTPEIVEEPAEEAQSPPSEAVEALARVRGWRPEDEYAGDKAKWVDAETFVKRGEENLGLSRAENVQLKKRISVLEGQIKKVVKSEQRSYQNALDTIKAEMRVAAETGDVAAIDALNDRADKIRKDMADDTPHSENPASEFASFRATFDWYDLGNQAAASDVERKRRAMADRLADQYAEEGLTKTMAPSAFFDKIGKEVEDAIPTEAKPARQKPASDVAGVTGRAPLKSAKTGANLPAEAKEAVRRYMRQGIYKGKTFEEASNLFANDFDWSTA